MQGLYPIIRRKRVPLVNAEGGATPAGTPEPQTQARTPAPLLPAGTPAAPEAAGGKERRAKRGA